MDRDIINKVVALEQSLNDINDSIRDVERSKYIYCGNNRDITSHNVIADGLLNGTVKDAVLDYLKNAKKEIEDELEKL